jgi:uncharacterized protein (DUF488 family)
MMCRPVASPRLMPTLTGTGTRAAGQAPNAIRCSEEDPARCHRHHVISWAIVDEVRVVDIRTGGGAGWRVSEAKRKPRQMTLM